MSREKATQKLADELFQNGLIDDDDDIKVRRLDYGTPFKVIVNEKYILGSVDYNPQSDTFDHFTSDLVKKQPTWNKSNNNKQDLSVVDYLRYNKINING